ncbi:MAG: N-acetylmuramoyl-L-alanine amidase [Longimicrobiales bacterium]|nr:N-acetylmuramoyl-L-alanine amidase [Longimicrobiales bacterium]
MTTPEGRAQRVTPPCRFGRLGRVAVAVVVALAALHGPRPARAQLSTETFVWMDDATGARHEVRIVRPEGSAMLRLADLRVVGIEGTRDGAIWRLAWGDHVIGVEPRRPAVMIDGQPVHLTVAPVESAGSVHLPVQLFIDVLPDRAPDLVRADGSAWRALILDPDAWGSVEGPSEVGIPAPDPVATPTPRDVTPVVIIDPGHGGGDPGSIGPAGVREKDVALEVGARLAERLRSEGFEVHLTREDDHLVPLWRRGPIATSIKGDRPGVFLSIHTNAVGDRAVRGFETYFLSEARTEDERRVAELENSAAQIGIGQGRDLSADPELGFILNELRNFDHQHWSADLAAVVQGKLREIHPGPDRGVKQGPLAVITNSIMPSVLIELGFISHPAEERVLDSDDFQEKAAAALAAAVREFFERYPPGGNDR